MYRFIPAVLILCGLPVLLVPSTRIVDKAEASKIFGGNPCEFVGEQNANNQILDNAKCQLPSERCTNGEMPGPCDGSTEYVTTGSTLVENCKVNQNPNPNVTTFCECNGEQVCLLKRTCTTHSEVIYSVPEHPEYGGDTMYECRVSEWVPSETGHNCLFCGWQQS